MTLADNSPPLSARELRQLWEQGQRGGAIRGVLESWESVIRAGDDLRWLEGALRRSGLPAEAAAVQAQVARKQGRDVRAWESLIESVLQSGDPWWARELVEEAGSGSPTLEALKIEVELAADGDASALISAWLRTHRDHAALEAAVGWWVRSGRVDEAERLVEAAEGMGVWRARLALWRNQPAVARPILGDLSDSEDVRCLDAIAAVQEGRLEHAESVLRTLLDGDTEVEAWGWLATVLRKQRRYAEAVRAADAAKLASPTTNLAAQLERELSVELEQHGPPTGRANGSGDVRGPAAPYETAAVGARLGAPVHARDRYARGEESRGADSRPASRFKRLLQSIGLVASPRARGGRMRTIGELEYAAALYALGLGPQDEVIALDGVLGRFGGNHTCHLTTVDQGKLTSYRLPIDPGQLGSTIRLVLWTRGPEAARSLFRELAPRVGGHRFFRNYQGELELWMGAYEEAARIFSDVIAKDPHVKWSWIGLGASAMLQGDLGDAQKIWEKGVSQTGPGPTLYAYRGECYRRQGELACARRELMTGVEEKPHRVSARINLALLDGAPEAVAQAERECTAIAPLLMESLSGSPAEKLEQVLEAMRGNRSSSPALVSYHLWGHVWRGAS